MYSRRPSLPSFNPNEPQQSSQHHPRKASSAPPKSLLLAATLIVTLTLIHFLYSHSSVWHPSNSKDSESFLHKHLPSFIASPPKRWVNQMRPFPSVLPPDDTASPPYPPNPADPAAAASHPLSEADARSLIERVYALLPEIISPVILKAELLPQPSPCLSKTHGVRQKLWIVMPAWRNVPLLCRAIESVISQRLASWPYKLDVTLVVNEDFSDEMMAEEDKKRYDSLIDITWLASKECDDPGDLNTCRNLGSAGSKWFLFEEIMRHALPTDYVFVLDGDDILSDSSVLSDLSSKVFPLKAWFMWGRHNGDLSEQCADIPRPNPRGRFDHGGPDFGNERVVANDEAEYSSFRTGTWSFCHPRIFKAFLLKYMRAEDFKRANGEWLQKATDRPFIFQMLERSGARRTHFIDERPPLIDYTTTKDNGLLTFSREVTHGDRNYVNSLPPVPKLPEVIHVIAALFDRTNTAIFMSHLARSLPPSSDSVYVFHLCANMPSRVPELLELSWRLSTPSHVFRIHTVDRNYGGFARFLVARELLREGPLDYVIFVDDDMMVDVDSLATLYKQRRPATYSCWYGKIWMEPRDDYWEHSAPRTWALRSNLRRGIKNWQYGGTGFSVIDAGIFEDERIFQLPEKYMFIEDLWLSYVVYLNEWSIVRVQDCSFTTDETSSASGLYIHLHNLKSEMLQELNQCPVSFFDISSAYRAMEHYDGSVQSKDMCGLIMWLLLHFGWYIALGTILVVALCWRVEIRVSLRF